MPGHARSIDCRCIPGYQTCRACLSAPPVYFYTLRDGSALADGPLQGEHAAIVRADTRRPTTTPEQEATQ